MGTGIDINFYPRICSCVDIGCNRRYDCGLIFIISDSLAPLVANVHTGNGMHGERACRGWHDRGRGMAAGEWGQPTAM
jgi:hypothetical protein